MHVRMNRFEIVDGKQDDLADAYGRSMEIMKTQKGFQEAVLLVDPETGQAVSLTFWDTQENMEASGDRRPGGAIDKIVPMVRPFQKAPPVRAAFAVKLRVK
jgi:hypothetical protein